MTKLKSFGCSFIFGDDLKDTFLEDDPWSAHTWPALLAQDSGLKHLCFAQSGSGNLQIYQSLLQQLADPEPAIFVIGWTWIDRFDYVDCNTNQWQTIRPKTNSNLSEFYYKHLHSQYTDKLHSLSLISHTTQLLLNQKRKFIITAQDPLILETQWHHDSAIAMLQDSIKPYVTWFNGQSFLDWTRTNNYAVSKNWHPLEQAHQAAFELIKSYSRV
jgi:hypothetical protein